MRSAIHQLTCLTAVFFGVSSFAADIDFNRDIRPILSNNCYACHGFDGATRKGGDKKLGGMRLDTFEGATIDHGGYRGIVPGKADASEIIARITTDDPDDVMPPKKHGKPLTPEQVATLRKWINSGARYDKHWSYTRPERKDPPRVKRGDWPKTTIDRFVLAHLEQRGWAPSAEADRYTLIRRLSLDITGLPPTIDEVEAFVNDKSPDAYEKLVDRLLASPAYGEHWARMWLDLARYADSAGYADDPPRTIWAYRDYVVRSLNANKPFDQFTIEQIAGDMLEKPTEEQLVATAFHRNTLTNNEGGTNDEEYRNVAIVDRVNTTMATWMGTTIDCAQCHDHKYDPISQKDFFEMFAIFNSTEDADRRNESPTISIFGAEYEDKKAKLEADVAARDAELNKSTPELEAAQAEWEKKFPKDIAWNAARPATAESKAKVAMDIREDGSVFVAGQGHNTDTYTVDLPLAAGTVTGLQLKTIPDAAHPGKGAGHAGGNFVVSQVLASLIPADADKGLNGQYVRVEIPGKDKILSLAEVQVFSGGENVAMKGTATQESTDHNGPPKLAIDGNTDGDYNKKSTTHTKAKNKDPWWEVDLKSVQAIDRIAVWNRTDSGTGSRLVNFRVSVLDGERRVVWTQDVKKAPSPTLDLSLSGVREVPFAAAYADYSQNGFTAESILKKRDLKKEGWAVAGKTTDPHFLTLVPTAPVKVDAGATLRVKVVHLSEHAKHTLGGFQLSVTDAPDVSEFARTPKELVPILALETDKRSDAQAKRLAEHFRSVWPALKKQRDELAKLQKQLKDLKPTTTVPVMKELAKPRTTKIQLRGNFLDTGDEVQPALPEVFAIPVAEKRPNRMTLAKWLIAPENPLTARVIVNRYWEHLFGIGIVITSEEFGAQGELPTNPELLDWLAVELMESGWDLKKMIKQMVTSASYRQESRVTDEMFERDPDNRYLSRGPRFRLSAEMVRDQALKAGGLLSTKMYGPPVQPPQPNLGVKAAFGSGIDWKTSTGEDKFRRGLYTRWRRSNPYPSMVTFDAVNREVCTVRRDRTNTPLQALVTLNDPVYVEAAQGLGRRMAATEGTIADKLTHGFRICVARPPRASELKRLEALYAGVLETISKDPAKAMALATKPIGKLPDGGKAEEYAAWTVVGNVLLNLDEMLMKR